MKLNVHFMWFFIFFFSRVGLHDTDVNNDVQLSGSNILYEHCTFNNQDGKV